MSMTNEEKYLKERVGQENPFRTPEGYFDQFTAKTVNPWRASLWPRRCLCPFATGFMLLPVWQPWSSQPSPSISTQLTIANNRWPSRNRISMRLQTMPC